MEDALPQTFKFKGLGTNLAFLALFDAICIVLALFTLTSKDGGVSGTFFCLGCGLVISLLGWVYVVGSSDIVLDVDGISRVFLGRRMKFMAWREIGLVTVFPLRSAPGGGDATGYNLIPIGPNGRLVKRRRIYFRIRGTELRDLLRCLNTFIETYDIKVQRESNGRITVVNSL